MLKHRGAIIMVARFLRTARNAIPYKKPFCCNRFPICCLCLKPPLCGGAVEEKPRYQFSANRAINCNLNSSASYTTPVYSGCSRLFPSVPVFVPVYKCRNSFIYQQIFINVPVVPVFFISYIISVSEVCIFCREQREQRGTRGDRGKMEEGKQVNWNLAHG